MFPVFSRNYQQPSHFFSENCRISNVAVTDGAEIYGDVENSIISSNVIVEEGAIVKDSILMPNTYISSGVCLDRCIVGMDTLLEPNVRATPDEPNGTEDFCDKLCSNGITVFGPNLIIREGLALKGNSMVWPNDAVRVPELVSERYRSWRKEMGQC